MKVKIFLLSISLVIGIAGAPQSLAATSTLTMSVRQTPSASETLLTLYGNLKPNRSGTVVKIQVDLNGKWTTKQTVADDNCALTNLMEIKSNF
jgi:hypothetical protein